MASIISSYNAPASPSKMVKMLSHPDLEGYTNTFVVPSVTSGATIGNGIDLSKQSARDLMAAGVPTGIINKILAMGLLGKTGVAAKNIVNNLPKGLLLTPDEVVQLSNGVTAKTETEISSTIPNWSSLPAGVQALSMSVAHQYGPRRFKNQNLFKQIVNRDYAGIRNNLSNWGDTTPDVSSSINDRYARLVNRIPLPTILNTTPKIVK